MPADVEKNQFVLGPYDAHAPLRACDQQDRLVIDVAVVQQEGCTP
jgi:hypothetical protein